MRERLPKAGWAAALRPLLSSEMVIGVLRLLYEMVSTPILHSEMKER